MFGLGEKSTPWVKLWNLDQVLMTLRKTASSKGLFAGLNLTHPTLSDVDGGFQAVPDFSVNLAQSSLRHTRWILVIEKEVRKFVSIQSGHTALLRKSRQHSEA
jgi:hypothetical protein